MEEKTKQRIQQLADAHTSQQKATQTAANAQRNKRAQEVAGFRQIRREAIRPALESIVQGLKSLPYELSITEQEEGQPSGRDADPSANISLLFRLGRGGPTSTLRYINYSGSSITLHHDVKGPQGGFAGSGISRDFDKVTPSVVEGDVVAFLEKVFAHYGIKG